MTTTTLVTAKVAPSDRQITVASATGATKGMLVRIGAEKFRIVGVSRAPVLDVVPGYDGTTAESHLVLSKVSFGLPSEFAVVDYSNRLQVRTGYVAIEDGISTAGRGLPAIRAAAHYVGLTATVPVLTTYTPLVTTTMVVVVSILITTTAAEAFTIFVSYTDTGGTPRVATLPLRLLTGVNVLAVAAANGAIPYAGVSQQFRALGGTVINAGTAGAIGGATYDCSAVLMDSQTGETNLP